MAGKIFAVVCLSLLIGGAMAQPPDIEAMSDEEFKSYINGMDEEEFEVFTEDYLVPIESTEDAALASITASIDFRLDQSGDAKMLLEEPIWLDYDEVSVRFYPSGSVLRFEGYIEDRVSAEGADFSMSLISGGTAGELRFESQGDEISELIDLLGPFELAMDMETDGSSLILSVDGSMSKALLELMGFNVSEMTADVPALRDEVQIALDQLSAAMPFTPQLDITLDELDISGEAVLQISARLTARNWREMYASALGESLEGEEGDIFACMGIAPSTIVNNFLGTDLEAVSLTLTGIGDKVSAVVGSRISSAPEGGVLRRLDIEAQKIGGSISIEGEIETADPERMMSCLMKDILGDYEFEDMMVSVDKTPADAIGTLKIESGVSGLAKTVPEGYELAIGADLTADYEITIGLPAGMEALSSSGLVESDGALKSREEEAIYLLYGKKAAGIGNLETIAAVVILILVVLLLLRRRKPRR